MRGSRLAVAFLVAVVVASACGGSGGGSPSAAAKPNVTIGSTNFSEQLILGELYAQILEANGYTVTRKFNLGAREIVFPALASGQIDLEADYLATLLAFVNKNATGSTDPEGHVDRAPEGARREEPDGPRLRAGRRPERLRGHEGDRRQVQAREAVRRHAVGGQLVLGGPPECPARPFCAAGLKTTYGITFKDFKPLDTGGPLTVAALKGGQVDIGLLFTSDSTIAVNNFVLLEDDKHLQLSDNIAPVVRNDLLAKAPSDFKSIINSIAPKLTTAELTAMNKQNDIDKTDPKAIAAAWLKKMGLVK